MTDQTMPKPFEFSEVRITPPGYDVERVKLQDDGHALSRAMLIVSAEMTGITLQGWLDVTDEHRERCMRTAKSVLALVDELQGQRTFKITMPATGDDSMVLRELFGQNDA